jgi:hypothetical protein
MRWETTPPFEDNKKIRKKGHTKYPAQTGYKNNYAQSPLSYNHVYIVDEEYISTLHPRNTRTLSLFRYLFSHTDNITLDYH